MKCKICNSKIKSKRRRVYCSSLCSVIGNRRSAVLAVGRKRKNIKAQAVAYKGGKCQICSYSTAQEALEFHHIEPEHKDFGLADKGHTRSWLSVKNEIDKCILLCSNCHRECHAGLHNISNIPMISTDLGIVVKSIKKWICVDCGDAATKRAKRCLPCRKNHKRVYEVFSTRKVERPSKEELEKLLWQKPTTQLATEFGVSGKAIEKWARKYGISKPPRGYWAKLISHSSVS